MNKEQFTMKLVNNLKETLGNEYFVRTEHVTKNNGVELLGVVIGKQNQTVCPNIYVESFYSQFRLGRPLESITREFISIYHKNNTMEDFDLVLALNQAHDKIFYKLINTEANQILVDNAPHKTWNDLSVIYYADFGKDEENCHKTLVINNLICELLGLSVDELDRIARHNTERLMQAQIQGISSLMEKAYGFSNGCEPDEQLADDELFYILSNTEKFYGASVVLYRNVLSDFAKRMNVENVYIIPSSIHEMLLIPDRGNMSVQELNTMICAVNDSELEPEEVLSSNCYIYTRQTNLISVA